MTMHSQKISVAAFLFAYAVFIAFALAVAPAPPVGWTTKAHVVRIIDGDTCVVEIRRTLHVRLDDCWCPESRTRDLHEKRLGLAAKGHLAELISGQPVILHIPASQADNLSKLFTLSRVVGTLWQTDNAESVNQQQITAGHAWPSKAEQKAAVERLRNDPAPPRKANP